MKHALGTAIAADAVQRDAPQAVDLTRSAEARATTRTVRAKALRPVLWGVADVVEQIFRGARPARPWYA